MTIKEYNLAGENPPPTAPVQAEIIVANDTAIAEVIAEEEHHKPVPQATKSSNPPPNCNDGGLWGTLMYNGEKTKSMACLACLCCGICGLFVLCCPQDEKVSSCKE